MTNKRDEIGADSSKSVTEEPIGVSKLPVLSPEALGGIVVMREGRFVLGYECGSDFEHIYLPEVLLTHQPRTLMPSPPQAKQKEEPNASPEFEVKDK